MGGKVRVGLANSIYAGKGRSAESNAGQVTHIRTSPEALPLEVASPAMRSLNGGDRETF